MADMPGFGKMDIEDRGGEHEYRYENQSHISPSSGPSPSQTVGPFFAYGLIPGIYGYSNPEIHSSSILSTDGNEPVIEVEGQVFDGQGQSVHDALVEFIQADASGKYATERRNDGFTGYARYGTGANGPAAKGGDTRFRFQIVKPGKTAETHSPFISVIVTMRGLLNHCITRLYFPEDDHAGDPVMTQVPEARRHTLIAKAVAPNRYRFDIHMQGENETVFFDI